MTYDVLRLHLLPRRTLEMEEATLENCVEHAERVVQNLASNLAHAEESIVVFDEYPCEGGMRYVLRGSDGLGVIYGVFRGDYFDSHMLSENIRMRNIGLSPAMKSYLITQEPFSRKAETILAVSSVMQHDLLLNYEEGFPKGWQAFLRRYEKKKGKNKLKVGNVKHGVQLLNQLGITPSEWAVRTHDGYERCDKMPMYLS